MNQSIYLALDFPTWQKANHFIKENALEGVPVKVGMELFYREGPSMIEKLKSNNHPVFLDLKLHDIPTTVKRAMKNLTYLELDMVTIHALGGTEMIRAAKEGLLSGNGNQTNLLAVTILTSMDERAMQDELNMNVALNKQVTNLAVNAKKSGADGVVSSVHEVKGIKAHCGKEFLTVTPGIRLKETATDDQKRVATPREAAQIGSDYLVIGRSITKAKDPKKAYETALKEFR
jgi:orotidine-5'-phosphate decarboxylase